MNKALSSKSTKEISNKTTVEPKPVKEIAQSPKTSTKTKKKLKPEDIKKMTKEEKLALIKSIIEGVDWRKLAAGVVSVAKSQNNPEDLNMQEIADLLNSFQDLFDLQKVIKEDKELQDFMSKRSVELFFPEYLAAIGIKLTEDQLVGLKRIMTNRETLGDFNFSMNPRSKIDLYTIKKDQENELLLWQDLKQIFTDEQFSKYIEFDRLNSSLSDMSHGIKANTKDAAVDAVSDYWIKEFSLPHDLKPQLKQIASEFYYQYISIDNYYRSNPQFNTDYFLQREKSLKLLDFQIINEEKLKAMMQYNGIKLDKQASTLPIKITEGP